MDVNELKVSVELQTWFSVLAEEFAKAGEKAASRGVPRHAVYDSVTAALLRVVPDAMVVHTSAPGASDDELASGQLAGQG